ncbi:Flp pilus assembly protein TadD [Sporomusaceae bacterium BoRhaA]|uniref:tetratricopeptide repeat protein n=1 Tax=Pelorhabdus rhamnosifermentans TaxID=2772457 RepID=UPI001C05F4A9|nr:tetratricopeptide repeat protein [Pelorhabdus rhamnosifermentans]MBU2699825.1 Flp pilus assembly protein TadD [Pelorhabdus rhamnosifermentans]
MDAKMYLDKGYELMNNGALQQAADAFCRAIEINSQYAEAYNGLGVVKVGEKLVDVAESAFRKAIILKPDFFEAYNNLGTVLINCNRLTEAEICLRQAIQLNPQYPEAYGNLGVVLMGIKQLAEAESCLKRAIELKSDLIEAYATLGLVLRDTNCYEAEEYLRRAIELNPKYPESYNNLGLVLKYSFRLDEAEACYRRAIELQPEYLNARVNLGILLKDTYRLDEAKACFCQVIEQYPNSVEASFALGILDLLQGKYGAEWWEKYELRRKVFGYWQPEIRYWQGENLAGCRILLYYEQGFGDTIQFIRYAKKVAELASETTVLIQKPLQQLMINSQKTVVISTDEKIHEERYDFTCSLLSLPFVFKTTQETIPKKIPYIQPEHEVVIKWSKILGKRGIGKRLRVGVVWAGNPNHKNDCNRSIAFETFRQLFDITEVEWVSLQVGKRAGNLKDTLYSVIDLSSRLIDFSETAGVISNLDLIISVDSAVAHLAGAMGKETWLLLPFAPDWRWQLEREDSDWYPTIRILRQQKYGDWQGVLRRVKELVHIKQAAAR